MKSMDLLGTIGSIRDQYILEAHSQAAASKKHIPQKRLFLIAAMIALLLLLVGCAVVLLGLQDARLGNYTYDIGFGQTQSGDFVSLQGFAGSPEYQAAQEWRDFCQTYDSDGSIIASIGNKPTGLDAKYSLYTVYTQDMADKLEEICEKYGLALRTQLDFLETNEDMFQRVGGDFLKENITPFPGYIYEDGTFDFDGDANVDGEIICFQFRRSVKGTFDDVYLNLKNISLYVESHSKTPTGDDLLLAVGPDRGVILGDLGDCFISVNVLAGDGQTITAEMLKTIANSFDYAILKNVVKPEMDEVLPSEPPVPLETIPNLEGSEAQLRAYRHALEDLYFYYDLPGDCEVGYDGIAKLSSNKFTIFDVDGDGSQELLILYGTTYNAGNTFAIYDYDEATGSIQEELIEYITASVWEGGVLRVLASHAHGLSLGEVLWPYTLYRYDPTTDSYEQIVQVDAWEKEYYPQDYSGNPFPEAQDADGDGVVYLLYFSEREDPQILDGEAFREWEDSYLVTEVSLPWVRLTPLNIGALAEEESFLPKVVVAGNAPGSDGSPVPVQLVIEVLGVSSDKAGYLDMLEQNPDTPAPEENQEYVIITLAVTYDQGALPELTFEETQATLYDAKLLFHLPGENSNSTDMTHLLKTPIWGQCIASGETILGQVAFLQEKGNTQPLYFVGYGQTVALDIL